MKQERIKKLQEFLQADPNDPFVLYALANEYAEESPEKSLDYYEQLMRDHPNYVATYYQAAHVLIEVGREEKAEEVFKTGILVCQQQGEQHTLAELQSAYNEFLFDDD